MSKKEPINFGGMAQSIMFAGTLVLSNYGVQYRAGHSVHSVNDALRKARKNGRGRVEYELGLLEAYLKGIFKAA